jgi:hypothetical protein
MAKQVLTNMLNMLKAFRAQHPDDAPVICVDALTECEFLDLTPADVGDTVVSNIVTNGPKSIRTLYGHPILWDAQHFEVKGRRDLNRDEQQRLAAQKPDGER